MGVGIKKIGRVGKMFVTDANNWNIIVKTALSMPKEYGRINGRITGTEILTRKKETRLWM